MLNVRKLSIKSKEKTLLDNINLTLYPGELTIILGANGAGKSTLLNSMAGGENARLNQLQHHGEVFFGGEPLTQWPTKELAKRRAIMPQQVPLNFPFSVKEVVMMGRSAFGLNRSASQIANEALALLEIDHLKDRAYTTLSGGEQQRTQLARVLTQIWPSTESSLDDNSNVKYLLLDECTSALDPAHQHQVFEVIKNFTDRQTISCAISHDLQLAAQYGDRVLLLKNGKLIADGKPKEVLNHNNLVETYQLQTKIMNHPEVAHPLVIGLGRVTGKKKR